MANMREPSELVKLESIPLDTLLAFALHALYPEHLAEFEEHTEWLYRYPKPKHTLQVLYNLLST